VIYYGDEVGMEGGGDPDCRRPFVWDRDQQDLDLLNFYRHMIRLRKEKVALRRGEFKTLYENKGIYSFARRLESQIIVVIFNNSNRDERVRIPLAGLRAGEGIAKDLLKKGDLLILTDKIETKISAYDLKLLELNI
jgi:glycosidase